MNSYDRSRRRLNEVKPVQDTSDFESMFPLTLDELLADERPLILNPPAAYDIEVQLP